MKEVLISLFSGIVGVLLTIGYQHFFAPSQSFAFVFNGQEVVVTQSEYVELAEENQKLQEELADLQNRYQESGEVGKEYALLQEEFTDLQNRYQELGEVGKEYALLQEEFTDLQNRYQELGEVDKEYELLQKELSQLQNENSRLKEEKEQLIEENISNSNKIEQLQKEIKELTNKSENQAQNDVVNSYTDENDSKVSIFTLETFSGRGGWRDSSYSQSSFTDTYGNVYSSAYEAYHVYSTTPGDKPPVYLLDNNYSKCEGQLAWPKERKDKEGSIWIEFYSDDELIYTTEKVSADDRALAFEFDVSGVEKLKICRKASVPSVYAIYPYLNLIK